MSFAVLVMLTCAESHNLSMIRRPFHGLHTLILERHTATALLATSCHQALSPHGHATRTKFSPGVTKFCRLHDGYHFGIIHTGTTGFEGGSVAEAGGFKVREACPKD